MGKRNGSQKRKLVLKKETLRQLQDLRDDELQNVGGGTLIYGGGGMPSPTRTTLQPTAVRCVLMPSINNQC